MHASDYVDMPTTVCRCLLLRSLLGGADPSYAKEFLGWEATRGYEEMCEDLWRWQSDNPDGFLTPAGSPRSLA